MLGATVLIVLGAERLLLAAAAPGVLGAAAFLLLGRPAELQHAAWAALAATPLLALALALARAARPGAQPAATAGMRGPRGRRGERGRSDARTRRERGGRSPARSCAVRCRAPGSGWWQPGCSRSPWRPACPAMRSAGVLVSLPLAMSMGAAEWIAHLVPAAAPSGCCAAPGNCGRSPPGAADAARGAAALPGRDRRADRLRRRRPPGDPAGPPGLAVLPQVAAYLASAAPCSPRCCCRPSAAGLSRWPVAPWRWPPRPLPRRRRGRPVGGLHGAAHRARRVRGPGAGQRDAACLLGPPAAPRAGRSYCRNGGGSP